MLKKYNETRIDKGPLRTGQIVFLKDFSVPKSGRARKFRTRYLKSPHVVLSSSSTSALTMRLADKFVSRHHPDAYLEFKGKDKMPELFQDLPEEVKRFLGGPISEQGLLELAKGDELEMIYVDKQLPEPEMIVTRSRAKKRDEEKLYEIAGILERDSVETEDEDEIPDKVMTKGKKEVTFKNELD